MRTRNNYRKFKILSGAIVLLILMGCSSKIESNSSLKITSSELMTVMENFEQVTSKMAKAFNADTGNFVFVDLRSPYDFEISHIPNAINIPTSFFLDDSNIHLFKEYSKTNQTVILYGQTERESISPWMLLQELGYSNTKVLLGGYNCFLNGNPSCIAEMARYNYSKISTAGRNGEVLKVEQPVPVKKVIPIQKKKKAAAEGGC